MRDLVIVGSGGFGREVADLVRDVNDRAATWNLLGFLDDRPSPENLARVERIGSQVLGRVDEAHDLAGTAYVIGIGAGAVRERLAPRLDAAGLRAVVLVHPQATIGQDTALAPGTVVCSQASVTTNVRIGRHVHVDRTVTVGHDVVVEEFATLHPAAVISGNVTIGARVQVGTHSTVLPGVAVGADAVVGAAACVVHDVPRGATVKGVPAR